MKRKRMTMLGFKRTRHMIRSLHNPQVGTERPRSPQHVPTMELHTKWERDVP